MNLLTVQLATRQRGTYGTGLALVVRLGPAVATAVCVAGVALGDIHLHFAWQAWHLATSTVTLLGRRGTYGTGLALVARLVLVCRVVAPAVCVAGVALGDIDLHFVLQAWHVWHWVGSGGALGSRLPPVDVAAVCVAGVALGDIDIHCAWQAWHFIGFCATPTW